MSASFFDRALVVFDSHTGCMVLAELQDSVTLAQVREHTEARFSVCVEIAA